MNTTQTVITVDPATLSHYCYIISAALTLASCILLIGIISRLKK